MTGEYRQYTDYEGISVWLLPSSQSSGQTFMGKLSALGYTLPTWTRLAMAWNGSLDAIDRKQKVQFGVHESGGLRWQDWHRKRKSLLPWLPCKQSIIGRRLNSSKLMPSDEQEQQMSTRCFFKYRTYLPLSRFRRVKGITMDIYGCCHQLSIDRLSEE